MEVMVMICQPADGYTTANEAMVEAAAIFEQDDFIYTVNTGFKFCIKTLTINRILLQNGQRKGINLPFLACRFKQ